MKKKAIVLALAATLLLTSLIRPVKAENPPAEEPQTTTATAANGVTYTYDAAGNRTARATGTVN